MIEVTSAASATARIVWADLRAHDTPPENAAVAIERQCAALGQGMGRWIGIEGYRILLQRAVDEVTIEHPALHGLTCLADGEQDVRAVVRAHGVGPVIDGVEQVVAVLIHLLGEVIGEEMAGKLVTQTQVTSTKRSTAQANRGATYG